MTRLFGHYIPRETIALLLADLLLASATSFVLIMAWPSGGPAHAAAAPLAANLAAMVALLGALIAVAFGLYRPESCLNLQRLALAAAALAAAMPVLIVGGGRLLGLDAAERLLQDGLWVALFGGFLVALTATRLAFRLALHRNLFRRRILVLGSGMTAQRLGVVAGAQAARLEFALPGPVASVTVERLRNDRICGVLVGADARQTIPAETLLGFRAEGIEVFGDADFQERQLRRLDLDSLDAAEPAGSGRKAHRFDAAVTRLLDLALCLALLLLTLPLMLLTALAIRLDTPGPVFYSQDRVGLHGRVYRIFKFRSMRTDAEAAGVPAWAAQNDSRVTRVGRWIRFTRIDELPQLLNVLRGDMAMVGPRPERPHFVDQLQRAIPPYRLRAQVKPGITGWAQVNYPYGASIEDARMKLSYDLYYVKHRSLFLDLLIVVDTVRVVLFREGSR